VWVWVVVAVPKGGRWQVEEGSLGQLIVAVHANIFLEADRACSRVISWALCAPFDKLHQT
jgi:hypothetical protein